MSALLGGFTITDARWLSPQGLFVRFTSIYSDRYHQMYCGRTLVGVSASFAARTVQGVFQPSHYPEELQLVAVTADDRDTDFGLSLPPRPYNRVELGFTTSGWTDAEEIDITAGDVPGGAVDANNLAGRIPFDSNRAYQFTTDPLPGSGTWNFNIQGRDKTLPSGNLGPALAASARIDARPPDVAFKADGSRLAATIAAGALTVGFTYNW